MSKLTPSTTREINSDFKFQKNILRSVTEYRESMIAIHDSLNTLTQKPREYRAIDKTPQVDILVLKKVSALGRLMLNPAIVRLDRIMSYDQKYVPLDEETEVHETRYGLCFKVDSTRGWFLKDAITLPRANDKSKIDKHSLVIATDGRNWLDGDLRYINEDNTYEVYGPGDFLEEQFRHIGGTALTPFKLENVTNIASRLSDEASRQPDSWMLKH